MRNINRRDFLKAVAALPLVLSPISGLADELTFFDKQNSNQRETEEELRKLQNLEDLICIYGKSRLPEDPKFLAKLKNNAIYMTQYKPIIFFMNSSQRTDIDLKEHIERVRISPNKKLIAALVNKEEGDEILITDLNSQLTTISLKEFYKSNRSLSEQAEYKSDLPEAGGLGWSPDSGRIYLGVGDKHCSKLAIYSIDLNGNTLEQLTNPIEVHPGNLSIVCSAKKDKIITADTYSDKPLWMIDLKNHEIKKFDEPTTNHYPIWSPSGEEFFYVNNKKRIMSQRILENSPKLVFVSEKIDCIDHLGISPDGKKLIFHTWNYGSNPENNEGVYSYNLVENKLELILSNYAKLGNSQSGSYFKPIWSSDSEHFYVGRKRPGAEAEIGLGSEANIYLINSKTKTAINLTENQDKDTIYFEYTTQLDQT